LLLLAIVRVLLVEDRRFSAGPQTERWDCSTLESNDLHCVDPSTPQRVYCWESKRPLL